jgi:hypothetical protein
LGRQLTDLGKVLRDILSRGWPLSWELWETSPRRDGNYGFFILGDIASFSMRFKADGAAVQLAFFTGFSTADGTREVQGRVLLNHFSFLPECGARNLFSFGHSDGARAYRIQDRGFISGAGPIRRPQSQWIAPNREKSRLAESFRP